MFIALCSCSSVFYYPDEFLRLTPADFGLEHESITINTPKQPQLFAWYLKSEGTHKGDILFLHGNAENISTHLASVAWLPSLGWGVLAVDYRGYGASEGSPDEHGVHRDAQRALNYLYGKGTRKPLGLLGQSIGGSTAIYLAAQQENKSKICALVTEGAFSDYRKVARDKLRSLWLSYPLAYPVSLLLNNSYSPLKFIRKISPLPLLILHGELDSIIDSYHSDLLFQEAQHPAERVIMRGLGHTEMPLHSDHREKTAKFFEIHCSRI